MINLILTVSGFTLMALSVLFWVFIIICNVMRKQPKWEHLTVDEVMHYNETWVRNELEQTQAEDARVLAEFKSRIDKEWLKHVKKCLAKKELVDVFFDIKSSKKLPWDIVRINHCMHKSANGEFSIHSYDLEEPFGKKKYIYHLCNETLRKGKVEKEVEDGN